MAQLLVEHRDLLVGNEACEDDVGEGVYDEHNGEYDTDGSA